MVGGRRGWVKLGVAALLATAAGELRAECISLISGPVVFDVAGCALINPDSQFDLSKEKYAWIKDLDPAGRKKFMDSYKGLYLKGKVVKSQAVSKGLTGESGALSGQTVYAFIPPSPNTCANVLGKRLNSNLREVCCDGGGDPPCLLNTGYLLLGSQAIGAAQSGAGDSARQKAKQSKTYQAAEKAFAQNNCKQAVKLYEQARSNDELDIKGHYNLGQCYRKIDQCKDAVPPLKFIHDASAKKEVWADEEPIARKATFLLARCYAKMNEPGPTVLLLQGYLLEPQKYKKEIKDSLSHKDFGWIHTSKEYRDYKKDAQKKLK